MTKTEFERVREEFSPKLEGYLKDFLSVSHRTTGKVCAEMSQYQLDTGGKRLRALIPCLVFSALGKDPHHAIPFGAAVEMIHNATLVHDDLQDGDQFRRHKPTVWKKYSEPQAINCGDAMFQYPFRLILNLPIPPERKTSIVDYMAECTLKVIEGQAQEFLMKEEDSPVFKRYLQIIEGKTSGLFALPIVGALLALGVEREKYKPMEEAALKLGLLFQVQDDLLDVYGQKGREKSATDVAEGKISALVAFVNESQIAEDRTELTRILRLPREETSDADIQKAVEIFDRNGAKEKTVAFIRKVQAEVKDDESLKKLPEIRALLLYLADLFLEPIQAIL